MAKAELEKEVCRKCGVGVRENTLFCYNCGNQVAFETETSAVDVKESDEKKLSRAAEERRKARVSQRKSNEFVWEPGGNSRLTFLVAILIAVVAGAVVFLTVFWK